jgi:hypothetical protein
VHAGIEFADQQFIGFDRLDRVFAQRDDRGPRVAFGGMQQLGAFVPCPGGQKQRR